MLAHAGQPLSPHDVWSSWGTDPVVYAALVAAAGLYLRGLCRLWATAGVGRGVARWQATAFGAGLLVCWLALESPVDAVGSALFSGHMLQHELLAVVAAPLLVLGDPVVAVTHGLAPAWRRRLGAADRLLTGAGRSSQRGKWLAGWFLVFVTSFWVWHLPVLYNAALRNDLVHSVQHGTFLVGAVGLWWSALGRHRKRNPLPGVGLLFVTVLQGTWGGALFVFATRAYYQPYVTTTEAWGLTAVEDINLGGVIMWIAGIVFIATAVVLLGSWLLSLDRLDAAGRSAGERLGAPNAWEDGR